MCRGKCGQRQESKNLPEQPSGSPIHAVEASSTKPAALAKYSVSSVNQGCTALGRRVQILVVYTGTSRTPRGARFRPILISWKTSVQPSSYVFFCEMAQYNHYFLVNLRLLTVKVWKVRLYIITTILGSHGNCFNYSRVHWQLFMLTPLKDSGRFFHFSWLLLQVKRVTYNDHITRSQLWECFTQKFYILPSSVAIREWSHSFSVFNSLLHSTTHQHL